MSPVNQEKIIALIAEVQKARNQLEQYGRMPAGVILSSPEKLNSIKYLFVIGIEACIDICQHLSAKAFQTAPESYSGCFDVLEKNGVIVETLRSRMAELAAFRNLLVHLYWRADDQRVVDHLAETGTMDEFTKAIAKYLKLM